MTLTVQSLYDEVRMATGAEDTSAWTSHQNIINQGIEYFNVMHDWQSMIRPEVVLGTTASQDYITLPTDFRDLIGIDHKDGVHNYVRQVSPDRLTTIRAYDDTSDAFAWGWYISVVHRIPTSGGGTTPTLELYPTPASTEADVFRLRYRALLEPVGKDTNADTQYVDVPARLEPLIRRLVRIHARAIEEETLGSLEQRLELLEHSQFLARIQEWEGFQQPDIGGYEGGAAMVPWYGDYFGDEPVNDPS